MEIRTPQSVRSLVSEASRQAQHYRNTGNVDLHATWSQFAALAFECQSEGVPVLILKGNSPVSPIPIKAGEQVEKLHIPKVIKSFRS